MVNKLMPIYNILQVLPNTSVLAVDSGKDWAWAFVDRKGVLVACGLRKAPGQVSWTPDRLVVEKPDTGQRRATKQDLITQALRAGDVGGRLGQTFGLEAQYVEAVKWGGSLAKGIKNARVLEKLSASERVLAGSNHNVLDAIGIALFCVGRF